MAKVEKITKVEKTTKSAPKIQGDFITDDLATNYDKNTFLAEHLDGGVWSNYNIDSIERIEEDGKRGWKVYYHDVD